MTPFAQRVRPVYKCAIKSQKLYVVLGLISRMALQLDPLGYLQIQEVFTHIL